MRDYKKPELVIEDIEMEDVIAASGNDINSSDGNVTQVFPTLK